jgi:hypothetical protein
MSFPSGDDKGPPRGSGKNGYLGGPTYMRTGPDGAPGEGHAARPGVLRLASLTTFQVSDTATDVLRVSGSG